jgi:hypothetical protein
MIAQAGGPVDKATGGGQTDVGTSGAGDTIAFTAQNTGTDDAARGNVTYIDRTGGTGQGQIVYHGDVLCLQVSGNMAKVAGTWRDGGPFQLLIVDNGQGSAADDDLVTVQNNQDPTCDAEDDDDDGQTALGRGNAQVYDAP